MAAPSPIVSLGAWFSPKLIFRKGGGQFKPYSMELLGLLVNKPFTKGSVA